MCWKEWKAEEDENGLERMDLDPELIKSLRTIMENQ